MEQNVMQFSDWATSITSIGALLISIAAWRRNTIKETEEMRSQDRKDRVSKALMEVASTVTKHHTKRDERSIDYDKFVTHLNGEYIAGLAEQLNPKDFNEAIEYHRILKEELLILLKTIVTYNPSNVLEGVSNKRSQWLLFAMQEKLEG